MNHAYQTESWWLTPGPLPSYALFPSSVLSNLRSYPGCMISNNLCLTLGANKDSSELSLSNERLVVALELDEVLCCSSIFRSQEYDHFIKYTCGHETFSFYLTLRPRLTESLTEISQFADLVLYTRATRAYAEAILQVIDPEQRLFTQRLYREHCTDALTKDLRKVRRPLNRVVAVESLTTGCFIQRDNQLLLPPLSTHPTDFKSLYSFLAEAQYSDNVLESVRQYRASQTVD